MTPPRSRPLKCSNSLVYCCLRSLVLKKKPIPVVMIIFVCKIEINYRTIPGCGSIEFGKEVQHRIDSHSTRYHHRRWKMVFDVRAIDMVHRHVQSKISETLFLTNEDAGPDRATTNGLGDFHLARLRFEELRLRSGLGFSKEIRPSRCCQINSFSSSGRSSWRCECF